MVLPMDIPRWRRFNVPSPETTGSMNLRTFLQRSAAVVAALTLAGCDRSDPAITSTPTISPGGADPLTIGVAFETLQTEYWVAGLDAIKASAHRRNVRVLESVADGDANRQLEQVKNFINRRVDGLIIVPKDGKTVIPMIKAANAAQIPVVLYNRPSDPTDAPHTVVAPDNFAITKATVEYLISEARKTGRKVKALVLLGDLGDVNAMGRRDGFEAAVKEAGDAIEVVARVPTEWKQEKALAGVQSAFQAHPDIGLIFTSSDFMFPSIKSVLSSQGKWKKVGELGHVILGGFDGDATAYQLMKDGYVDATGVQDVFWESDQAVQVIAEVKDGKPAPARIEDKGFVITQANLKELESRMWGAQVANRK